MRATVAILFASLLVWAQVVTGMSPVQREPARTCCGCDCQTKSCCPSQAPTRAPAPPTATTRLASENQAKLPAPSITFARVTPAVAPLTVSLPPVSRQAPALPLYQRHRALLL